MSKILYPFKAVFWTVFGVLAMAFIVVGAIACAVMSEPEA